MKKLRQAYLLTSLLLWRATGAGAQVPQEVMRQIYDEVQTPCKYGLVVAPADNRHKFDCPTVFREDGRWLMSFVCYDGKDGTDGRGYETWLAESDDLLHWRTLGRMLALPPADADGGTAAWDQNQRGGFPALIDMDWDGTYAMQTHKRRHWMTYIGGPGTGYEAVNAPLSIGLASTKKPISSAHQWTTQKRPLLSYDDEEAQWWERLTQYKSTIYRVDHTATQVPRALPEGFPYVMFYNAGGKDDTHPKGERIGIALSRDMKHWQRFDGNPVFAHDSDGTITGDAQIVRMLLPPTDGSKGRSHEVFVMFYFSAFNPTRAYNAYNTFAASYDLVHWKDWTGPDLIVPSKPYDELFAHKSCVVKHDGVVYHFYCAVNNDGQRGIAVATSRHLGKSEVRFPEPEPTGHRLVQSLCDDWEIRLLPDSARCNDTLTLRHDVPWNLDDYYGTQQSEHGNLHGEALFRKTFRVKSTTKDAKNGHSTDSSRAFFLHFDGVGTYADVTLNGHYLGHYDIGRTTEMLNVTPYLHTEGDNDLEVRVSHPAGIVDMPWVCGGCSTEWGFSEGSQPFGIFRPVWLEATDLVRVEPFGVHVWTNDACDSLFVETELHNYGNTDTRVQLVNKLCEKDGRQVVRMTDETVVFAGKTTLVRQVSRIDDAKRWSPDSPYLYHLGTIVKRNGKASESTDTPFGFSTAQWPRPTQGTDATDGRFRLNGQPIFINGVCEYEHAFGQSHAFSREQIASRVKLAKDAGFNAWRDAHQPHHLYYQELLDREGMLWWPQFSAHIWYDTPEFRESFKRHLRQWVKERRNSPSLVLWGLQNESTLPRDFAEECTAIIREMDPRCGTSRLVTTCNGGEGTDWNVVQNWSGTYGGDPAHYGEELKQPAQRLNGEYGAWRTLGNHTGQGYTEDAFERLLMQKVKQAESVRDSVCGQFLWLLVSHDNPGRRQPDEALRRVDKAGPYNYKGLLSPWEQPTNAYYAYLQHYRPQPLASPASHISEDILRPEEGYKYLYRLNCGGDDYTDEMGNFWMQDRTPWSQSWGQRYGLPYQTSQTRNDSLSSPLFQCSRFGRHELSFRFPAAPGNYRVELYFVEPWWRQADAEGLRMFDVAIDDSTVITDLDIWAQVHYGRPYKRVVQVEHAGGELKIDFPRVKAGQAIIAAIAIATDDHTLTAPQAPTTSAPLWAPFDRDVLVTTPDSLLPPRTTAAMQVDGQQLKGRMEWDFSVGVAKTYVLRWKYYNPQKERRLHVKLTDANGIVYRDDDVSFLQTQQKKTKRRQTSISTGGQVNAGAYHVTLTGEGLADMIFDPMTVE